MIRRDIILKLFHNENSYVKLLKIFKNSLGKIIENIEVQISFILWYEIEYLFY